MKGWKYWDIVLPELKQSLTWAASLCNIAGHVLYKRQINHPSGNAVYGCPVGVMPAGVYQLQITDPNKTKRQMQQLTIQQNR